VGCGKKEEPAPAPAPAPAAAPAEAPKPEPLKIAFAYVGPVGDGGWTFAHDNGRKAIEAEFGNKVVTSFVEKVPEAADAELFTGRVAVVTPATATPPDDAAAWSGAIADYGRPDSARRTESRTVSIDVLTAPIHLVWMSKVLISSSVSFL
jgi:hypothetical protein